MRIEGLRIARWKALRIVCIQENRGCSPVAPLTAASLQYTTLHPMSPYDHYNTEQAKRRENLCKQ